MQRQVPAHIGVPHDQIRPQAAACRQAGGNRPQLSRRKPPRRRDQAAQHRRDGLLAHGADTPAGLQPRAGLPTLGAGTTRRDSGSGHATLPGKQPQHISPGHRAEHGRSDRHDPAALIPGRRAGWLVQDRGITAPPWAFLAHGHGGRAGLLAGLAGPAAAEGR